MSHAAPEECSVLGLAGRTAQIQACQVVQTHDRGAVRCRYLLLGSDFRAAQSFGCHAAAAAAAAKEEDSSHPSVVTRWVSCRIEAVEHDLATADDDDPPAAAHGYLVLQIAIETAIARMARNFACAVRRSPAPRDLKRSCAPVHCRRTLGSRGVVLSICARGTGHAAKVAAGLRRWCMGRRTPDASD